MSDIVVLGSLNMDLVVKTDVIPLAGETVRGQTFKLVCGGKGSNQAIAIARFGGNVTMSGCVGDDPFGRVMIENLQKSGVDAQNVRIISQASTGIAAIIVDADGDNRIIIVGGANGLVTDIDVQACLPLLKKARALVLQFEIPMNTVVTAAKAAHAAGVPVILNPAPVLPIPDEMYPYISTLILNEHEAKALTGLEVLDDQSAIEAARVFIQRGIKEVILTMGGQGALLMTQSILERQPAYKVKVVDTTGAGDAFIGGFSMLRVETGDLLTAFRFAVAAGSLTVTKFGASDSIPTRGEVEAFINGYHQS